MSAGEFEIVGAGNDPVDRFPMPEFVLLLRAGAMFSVEHSGLSVYSVFVRGRLRRPVVSLRNPGRILSDTALRGPGFAGVAVGEGPGSGGDRIKNSTTGIIFIKNKFKKSIKTLLSTKRKKTGQKLSSLRCLIGITV